MSSRVSQCRVRSDPCLFVPSRIGVRPRTCRALSSWACVHAWRAVPWQTAACPRVRVMSAPHCSRSRQANFCNRSLYHQSQIPSSELLRRPLFSNAHDPGNRSPGPRSVVLGHPCPGGLWAFFLTFFAGDGPSEWVRPIPKAPERSRHASGQPTVFGLARGLPADP